MTVRRRRSSLGVFVGIFSTLEEYWLESNDSETMVTGKTTPARCGQLSLAS